MNRETVDEIIACLQGERTIFSYFPGRYALVLLAYAAQSTASIRALRACPFAPLLEKPLVKSVLAECGDGNLDGRMLDVWLHHLTHDFLLGLTAWGGNRDRRYHQTSRRGCNLVLQLNFNSGDMARFAKLVRYPRQYNTWEHPSCRPSAHRYRETLAWARMDISFDTDEVLIEEVQSDFVRFTQWFTGNQHDPEAVAAFCRPFRKVWAEAMLMAAIDFIWQELGISNIYYHEHHTGAVLKGLRTPVPPRSIYDKLPRQFCMVLTSKAPQFLLRQNGARKTLRRLPQPRFFHIQKSCHTNTGVVHNA